MKTLKNETGFTLVEMLVVLAIIGMLVLLILPSAGTIIDRAEEQACRAQERSVAALNSVGSLLNGLNVAVPENCTISNGE
ncbi:MAG: prepilin-type N-terminal cleavage/methylation domain-containing protein [Turicibacter sp.]|nr:prepilin-type N-terminal cleavage/methylation domain-containing protein [Turicibacter sp.]